MIVTEAALISPVSPFLSVTAPVIRHFSETKKGATK